ncbi:MAG: glycosyltransferase family 2 protein [Caldilineaceae bacterium]
MTEKDPLYTTIIIPNFNGVRHFPALFTALSCQSYSNFKLLVIDDASSDNSLWWLEERGKEFGLQLQVIANRNNIGFAAACNQGISAAVGNWVVLLNNDTQPEPIWLESLLEAAVGKDRVGMVASKMLFAHDPQIINSAGIALDWMGIAWDWRGGEADTPHETQTPRIFGPCGGAALYSRQMLEELGGLDEDFFMYLEDVDLAWRAQLAGWQAVFQPKARILHAHSASLGDASPRKSFLLGRNKLWLIVKNYPNPWFSLYLPLILAYDLLATIYGGILRRNFALARGRLAGLQGLGKMLAKRKEIQRRWHDVDNWRSVMSPVELPWKVSQRYSHLRTTNSKAKSM